MAFREGLRNLRDLTVARMFLAVLVALIVSETSDCAKHPWHSLVLSQEWPQTVCLRKGEECKVPPGINYWTVHGLWPKSNQMCNNSWHFNIKNVQDILSDLKQWWPDLIHPNSTQLWKHEWQKHGTCAATLESLNSQNKYFSKALELFKTLDLNSVLEKSNILPSSKYYTMEVIEDALVRMYGVTPKIQCMFPSQGVSVQTLGQIEFCFTKEFQLLNCTKAAPSPLVSEEEQQNTYSQFGICDPNTQISYPPIEHLH
ncbi:ribonuclease T2 isoform X1 [Mobula hypostoma]|uniref:ribonuclease T2 isoform X1 n=1 Tax=Mobula hypostoma TaxID=723540 RepID=UPI002FC34228